MNPNNMNMGNNGFNNQGYNPNQGYNTNQGYNPNMVNPNQGYNPNNMVNSNMVNLNQVYNNNSGYNPNNMINPNFNNQMMVNNGQVGGKELSLGKAIAKSTVAFIAAMILAFIVSGIIAAIVEETFYDSNRTYLEIIGMSDEDLSSYTSTILTGNVGVEIIKDVLFVLAIFVVLKLAFLKSSLNENNLKKYLIYLMVISVIFFIFITIIDALYVNSIIAEVNDTLKKIGEYYKVTNIEEVVKCYKSVLGTKIVIPCISAVLSVLMIKKLGPKFNSVKH